MFSLFLALTAYLVSTYSACLLIIHQKQAAVHNSYWNWSQTCSGEILLSCSQVLSAVIQIDKRIVTCVCILDEAIKPKMRNSWKQHQMRGKLCWAHLVCYARSTKAPRQFFNTHGHMYKRNAPLTTYRWPGGYLPKLEWIHTCKLIFDLVRLHTF